ncbi:MAG: hypothetical protein LUQ50_07770 [Methanospirillum sp.]|uniref:hypothetical protein n=1 Tax=Methanospirillum sp. TaxID=45200 RepID=UPI00236A2974|nr:hypothetical protein [Methanospirillum sp.]MDD1728953.1 hypothetical protein [Methanospirillum sp.]
MKQSVLLTLSLTLILITMVVADDQGYSITKHIVNPGDVIGDTSWSDNLMTNGGKLAINKNFDFDSQNQAVNTYNIQTQKVLTYDTANGSHLLGEERYLLNIAGSYKPDDEGYLHCVYAPSDLTWLPAFCNTIQAGVSLMNVNHARISESGSLRMVGEDRVPAGLNYQVAITPDTSSGVLVADGIVRTSFGGSIMEARDNQTNVSATNQWKDVTGVVGDIKDLQKTFTYQSGLRL